MAESVHDFDGHVLIVGASAAGVFAAKEIRKVNRSARVTLLSEEPHLPYYRPLLTRRIADESVESSPAFRLNREEWYRENDIALTLGEKVVRVLPEERKAVTDRNREIVWDRLILASGSRPFVPVPGALAKKNVFAIRTLDDARAVHVAQQHAKRVVVIGGGLLGLEAADSLLRAGKKVFVVELADRILPIQLDPEGSGMFETILERERCPLFLGDLAESLIGEDRVSSVRLKSGREIPTDMVVFSIGVRANLDLAGDCGVTVNRGMRVNERMETGVPGIFACGDVAETGTFICLWMPAVRQGAVAGLNAIGGDAVFSDEDYPASMISFGTMLFSVGDIGRQEPLGNYIQEERVFSDRGIYKKLYFRHGRLVGGVFIGDNRKAQQLARAVRSGATKEEAEHLLED